MSEREPAGGLTRRWRVILPVKGTDRAKTRLAVAEGISRADLAEAMALDTLAAVLSCDLVSDALVVTSDPSVAGRVSAEGAIVVADPGRGLDDAVRRGVARAAELGPEGGSRPVAVLLADVPALRSDDLAAALTACERYAAAYVPDLEGTGTVLLAASRPDRLHPAFGDGSARRHGAQAERLDLDLPRLRRDVDLDSTLRDAVALGVGPRTARVLGGAG